MRFRRFDLVALICVSTSATAFAQQTHQTLYPTWQPYPFGGRTATMGGAGMAAGRDSAMPLLNPAGLAQIDRQNLSMSAQAYTLHALDVDGFFTRAEGGEQGELLENDPQAHGPLDTMRAQATDVFPTSFVYSWPLGAPVGEAGHHVLSLAILLPLHIDEALSGRYAFDVAGMRTDWLISRHTRASSHHVGPAWGVQIGRRVRLGAAAFAAYDVFDRRTSMSDRIFYGAEGQTGTTVDTVQAWSLGALGVAGMQADLPGHFQLGATVRSPSLPVLGHLEKDGSVLAHASEGMILDGVTGPGFSARTRLRTDRYEVRHPLRAGLGLGHERKGVYAVALDAHYVHGTDYTWASGTLSETIHSEDGTASTASSEVDARIRDNWLVDLNAGAEVFLTETIALRAGAFTDLSPAATVRERRDQSDLFRRKVNMYGGTLGLGFLFGAVDFTVGAVFSTGRGEMAAMRNPVNPAGAYAVAPVTETRLAGIVTGGVSFGEAAAPIAKGLERPIEVVAARFRREEPRRLRLSELEPSLAPLEGTLRDDLARRVDAAGVPRPLVYEVVGDRAHDELFRDIARLEGAVIVLQGSLGRAREALSSLREALAELPAERAPIGPGATDAELLGAFRKAPAAAPELAEPWAALAEEERLCRLMLQVAAGQVAALIERGARLWQRAADEPGAETAVVMAVALRQAVRQVEAAGNALAGLRREVAATFGER